MRAVILLALLGLAAAVPRNPQRIVGGSVTTINQYPFAAALLYSNNGVSYFQSCGGTILNRYIILTAAHCLYGDPATRWRSRVGSTNSNSGGTVYNSQSFLLHPSYNTWTSEGDIALIRVIGTISLSNTVAVASIAGPNYNPADNQPVWAIGWGTTSSNGPLSPQLRHVQIWTVNQNTCRNNYATRNILITNNMLCAGWLGVGGRDQCQGDSGGPLMHNGVVSGVCSFGFGCAQALFPGVNARVSSYSTWIQNNA